MSPNGRELEPAPEETEPDRGVNHGVLRWSINSQPPTPRRGDSGKERALSQTPFSDYEQAFDN
eukprot:4735173-Amphidinium_carterae.1